MVLKEDRPVMSALLHYSFRGSPSSLTASSDLDLSLPDLSPNVTPFCPWPGPSVRTLGPGRFCKRFITHASCLKDGALEDYDPSRACPQELRAGGAGGREVARPETLMEFKWERELRALQMRLGGAGSMGGWLGNPGFTHGL